MKIVRRKGKPKVDAVAMDSLQPLANELRKGRPFMPKGVGRFKIFEEADAWTFQMITRCWEPRLPTARCLVLGFAIIQHGLSRATKKIHSIACSSPNC